MTEFHTIDIWVGGFFVESPNFEYKGGGKHSWPDIDLDIFNFEDLKELYTKSGGKAAVVNFYYKFPGHSLEFGLRLIEAGKRDHHIRCIQKAHEGIEVPISIYSEEVSNPIEIIDTQGNIIFNAEDLIEVEKSNESEFVDLLTGIDFTDDFLEQDRYGQDSGIFVPHDTNSLKRNIVADVDVIEENDSSDPDYSQSEEESDINVSDQVDSDTPSVGLQDLEFSSDDDILVHKNPKREQLIQKLRAMLKKTRAVPKRPEPVIVDEQCDWYSEPEDADELESLSGSDDDGTPKFQFWKEGMDMRKFVVEVGIKFESQKFYRKCLIDWAILQGYELHWVRSESKRVTAECKVTEYTWRVHASIIQGSEIFQIKTIKGHHCCAQKNSNDLATAAYLAGRVEETIKDMPNISIPKLIRKIRRKTGVEVCKWKAIRVRRLALESIRGAEAQQYARLWDYCATVRHYNPGSSIYLKKVEDSNSPIFEKMYMCLTAMREGFQVGCRPIIGLDGCFLKTAYGGQLLVAVGRDGNDNMWPIAFAVVRVENKESWVWFIQTLLEDIGGIRTSWWSFVTDRQKGLLEALKQLVPDCEHRFCVRHMYENFKNNWSSPRLKELLWKAACASNKDDFEEYMREIEVEYPKVDDDTQTPSEWLREIAPKHWSRSHFETFCKSDVLVNNICESFNNFILEARDKPIITMCEWIRERIMQRIQMKRECMEKYSGNICPNILKKLNKQAELSRHCYPIWCGGFEFQVDHNLDKIVVHLDKDTCSCGMFQLNGYPCCHAYAAIAYRRYNVEDYVSHFYTKETYMKVYNHMIHGVPGQKHYVKTDVEPLGPPKFEKKRGKPKKLRRKAPGEIHRNPSTRGLTHICQKCLKKGHNIASCTFSIHPKSKFYKDGNTKCAENSQSHVESQTGSSQLPVEHISQFLNTVMRVVPVTENIGATPSDIQAQTICLPQSAESQPQQMHQKSTPSKQPTRRSKENVYKEPRSAKRLGKAAQVSKALDMHGAISVQTNASANVDKQKNKVYEPNVAKKKCDGSDVGGMDPEVPAKKRSKNLQISDVFENTKKRSKQRRGWKP